MTIDRITKYFSWTLIALFGVFSLLPRRETDVVGFQFGWRFLFSDLKQNPTSPRFWVCLGFLIFWILVWAFLIKLGKEIKYTNLLPLLIGVAGLGAIGVLGATGLGAHLSYLATRALLAFPIILAVPGVYYLYKTRPKLAEKNKKWSWDWIKITSVALWIRILWILIPVAGWAFFRKPDAQWDEKSYWWVAVDGVNPGGFWNYIQTVAWNHYDPGYPLVSSFLLLPLSPSIVRLSEPVLGVLIGVFFLFIVLERTSFKNFETRLQYLSILILYLALVAVQPWISLFWFQYLNGEPWAVICLMYVLLSVDPGDYPEFLEKNKKRKRVLLYLVALQCIGVGALSQIMKPPLNSVLHLILVGWLVYTLVFERKLPEVKFKRQRIAFLFLGLVLAKIVWAAYLRVIHVEGIYDYPLKQYLNPDFSALKVILPVWFRGARLMLIGAFGVLSAVALKNMRRYIYPCVVCLGMVLLVLFIYATVRKGYETGSADRYFLHGTMAWVFYVAMMKRIPT